MHNPAVEITKTRLQVDKIYPWASSTMTEISACMYLAIAATSLLFSITFLCVLINYTCLVANSVEAFLVEHR